MKEKLEYETCQKLSFNYHVTDTTLLNRQNIAFMIDYRKKWEAETIRLLVLLGCILQKCVPLVENLHIEVWVIAPRGSK